MSARNDLLKNTFLNVINDYEYDRPKYPQKLYGKISMLAGIDDRLEILKVGAGALGINTMWVTRSGKAVPEGVVSIVSLMDILDKVDL